MQGQGLIFEHALLFAISVAIFIACFALFNIYQSYLLSVTTQDQLNGVKDLVTSNILEMTKLHVNSSIKLNIPKLVGNEPYEIELSEDGVNVTALISKLSVSSHLYNLNETFEFEGKVLSSKGRCVIYKKGNNIILSG